MCKYLESESAMMLLVPLMCWEYGDKLLLTRFQTNHQVTVSWDYYFTGSDEALFIQPRSLEISIKARIWDTCPS